MKPIVCPTDRRWAKSHHSGGDNGSQCVEVQVGAAMLRDTKNPHVELSVGKAGGQALLAAVRSGMFAVGAAA